MSRVPFKCPVCFGRGQVADWFYEVLTEGISRGPVECRACKGTGIIWGVGTDPESYTAKDFIGDQIQIQEKQDA